MLGNWVWALLSTNNLLVVTAVADQSPSSALLVWEFWSPSYWSATNQWLLSNHSATSQHDCSATARRLIHWSVTPCWSNSPNFHPHPHPTTHLDYYHLHSHPKAKTIQDVCKMWVARTNGQADSCRNIEYTECIWLVSAKFLPNSKKM